MLVALAMRRGLRSSCMLKSPHGSPHIHTCQRDDSAHRLILTLSLGMRSQERTITLNTDTSMPQGETHHMQVGVQRRTLQNMLHQSNLKRLCAC